MNVFNEIQMTKKAVKRVQFIYFRPMRVLFERDDETLSEQMKKLKKELKIKIDIYANANFIKYTPEPNTPKKKTLLISIKIKRFCIISMFSIL